MKIKMMFVAMVVAIALTGCPSPTGNDPPSAPNKVVIAGVQFYNVSLGPEQSPDTTIYQIDGAGDYFTTVGDVPVASLNDFTVSINDIHGYPRTFVNSKYITGVDAYTKPAVYFHNETNGDVWLFKTTLADGFPIVAWGDRNGVGGLNGGYAFASLTWKTGAAVPTVTDLSTYEYVLVGTL
jgi:hypothetical protein